MSKGHEVVVLAENYLKSIGKNNSVGKYDKIVQGVRGILGQSLLDGDDLRKAAERECDKLLKKYNMNDCGTRNLDSAIKKLTKDSGNIVLYSSRMRKYIAKNFQYTSNVKEAMTFSSMVEAYKFVDNNYADGNSIKAISL